MGTRNSIILRNFGRNLSFVPQNHFAPKSEAEVLEILGQFRDKQIRVIGRLHSWSEIAKCDDVVLDLRCLNEVTLQPRSDGVWASVGAGCQIKRLLAELERLGERTTPTVGLITEQTVAGAISTSTHGSGRHSLSHYVQEIRLATYDHETGQPIIRILSAGPELDAARCSLGCMGVILSVAFPCRPTYRIEEHIARYARLDQVLAAEERFPLQQFYLVPWTWNYMVQHRRETDSPLTWLFWLYRFYCFWMLDISTHLSFLAISRVFKHRWWTHAFFRNILPLAVVRGWKVIDWSPQILTMRHELFRHIEIEVFVKRSSLADALDVITQLLKYCDGDSNAFSPDTLERIQRIGHFESINGLLGTYTHHCVICVRKVLPDSPFLSMANSDNEAYYAISFISFALGQDREPFLGFAEVLSKLIIHLFAGRPHWGKICPINASEVEAVYPRLPEFRKAVRDCDPTGRFRNNWVSNLLFADETQTDSIANADVKSDRS